MKSYRTLAWRELKEQKVTAVLILVAVILSSIMTTAAGESIGILQSMRREQAAGLNGDRYATFHQLSKEQAKSLKNDNRLYDVGDMLTLGSTELKNSGLTLFLRECDAASLAMFPSTFTIKNGRLPEKEDEIALSEDALTYLNPNASIGDSISLDLSIGRMDGSIPSYEYTAAFRLTGILENNYLGYSSGTVEGIAGTGASAHLLPKDYLLYSTSFKTHSKTQFQDIVTELMEQWNIPETDVQYNWVLLDAIGISYEGAGSSDTDTGFSFLAFACILVCALVLLAAGLVIYNILKISITKRIQTYGTLRALGSERGQIYRLVSLQMLILCGIGIPIGLLFGLLSAKGILTASTGILNPELFLADSTERLNQTIASADMGHLPLLLLSVVITLLFAAAAVFPAARYASCVSPTVAMHGQPVRIKRRISPLGHTLKIRRFEAWYARLNLKRSKSRTVITMLSLVMSITVFVALHSFTGILDASRAVSDLAPGDYAVTNETMGIPAEAIEELRSHKAVKQLSTTKLTIYSPEEAMPFQMDFSTQSHETLQIASIDEQRLSTYLPGLTEQELEELRTGAACLVKNPTAFSYGDTEVPFTSLKAGDTITVGRFQMRIIGLADNPVTINNDGFINGIQLIVNETIYHELTGSDTYQEAYPLLKEDADTESLEQWLTDWSKNIPGTHWLSYRQSEEQMAESFAQTKLLCWIFIAFIGIIGILNIINTVYSNIHTRVTEIGMQRALGMSRKSLYQTFLWEGAYYGIFATLFGAILGYFCSVFIEAARSDKLQLVPVPFSSIGMAALCSITACLLATAVPLRAIAKLNIVESIETAEQ